jgi:hypothetical protein
MGAKIVKFDRKKYFCTFLKICICMRIGWRNMRVKFRNPLMSLELMRIFFPSEKAIQHGILRG